MYWEQWLIGCNEFNFIACLIVWVSFIDMLLQVWGVGVTSKRLWNSFFDFRPQCDKNHCLSLPFLIIPFYESHSSLSWKIMSCSSLINMMRTDLCISDTRHQNNFMKSKLFFALQIILFPLLPSSFEPGVISSLGYNLFLPPTSLHCVSIWLQ